MKKIYYLLFTLFLIFASCEESKTLLPGDIDNVKVEIKKGSVLLKWDVSGEPDYAYVEIEYTNPRTGEKHLAVASPYANEKEINNLLKKDGEYTFHIRTVSADKVKSTNVHTLSATCLPCEAKITDVVTKVIVSEEMSSTNAQEPNEGPLKNLFDGNLTNFFHTPWSIKVPMPHWVDIDLGEGAEIKNFYITTTCRSGKPDGAPMKYDFMGSQDGKNWTILYSEENAVHENSKPLQSPVITCDPPIRYFRYNVRARSGNRMDYFSLAEMEVFQINRTIYDPENEN